jgi:riboflavin kinase/FMN adenylyltransferase
VRVRRGLRGPALLGACNVGLNPTFRGDLAPATGAPARVPVMVEAFIMDFDADLYGEWLRVEFILRLRPERRFPSAQALAEQIKRDVEEARKILG